MSSLKLGSLETLSILNFHSAMPFVDVETRTGNVKFKYTISTPTSDDSSSIEPSLPTILFIHPVFTAAMIFHSQFADPRLRRFNLVTFDVREHGETVGQTVPRTYDQFDAAEDTIRLMDALSLPPCHFFGLASGATVALQVTLSYPTRVLSLTLLSHECIEEPLDVSEGHVEVYERWKSGLPGAETVDEELLGEAMIGAAEYAFTNLSEVSEVGIAIAWTSIGVQRRRWTHSNLDALKTYVVDFMKDRKSHPISELARITCPVVLIAGTNDIAYDLEYSERFCKQLEEAGVDVSLVTIPKAPHYLCVDYSHIVNPLLYDLVMSQNIANSANLPAIQPEGAVRSPWHSQLKEYGWKGSDPGSPDDDDDDIFFV
ncbi:alpha beta hydrolase fold protein [Moniliophthora roreri]|nr:alpha beta hydrolase fold protein [Moniliophthora roreri]